eukprot:gnl/Carplike_NY0171/3099_a4160_480.p1 GENE.gnl/Carplike_NY0171/3099_a4160_480~~gnl/Carplike_NY0171/3099_a4160_480.p1  ORF type:complete len:724 (-),score=202.35 gnl/Carplike_NY0171/3099_a4160_480:191-2098(-)
MDEAAALVIFSMRDEFISSVHSLGIHPDENHSICGKALAHAILKLRFDPLIGAERNAYCAHSARENLIHNGIDCPVCLDIGIEYLRGKCDCEIQSASSSMEDTEEEAVDAKEVEVHVDSEEDVAKPPECEEETKPATIIDLSHSPPCHAPIASLPDSILPEQPNYCDCHLPQCPLKKAYDEGVSRREIRRSLGIFSKHLGCDICSMKCLCECEHHKDHDHPAEEGAEEATSPEKRKKHEKKQKGILFDEARAADVNLGAITGQLTKTRADCETFHSTAGESEKKALREWEDSEGSVSDGPQPDKGLSPLPSSRKNKEKGSSGACTCEGELSPNGKRKTDYSSFLLTFSFSINVFLIIIKIVASIMSGSMTVITSTIDSALDIVSGSILFIASKIAKHDSAESRVRYPMGKKRAETLGVLVFAIVMGVASILLIQKSITIILQGGAEIDFSLWPTLIIGTTILLKLMLFILCKSLVDKCSQTEAVEAYSQDHGNDVLSNSVGMVFALLADRYWDLLDPIGSIILSIYILFNWLSTAMEQIQLMLGIAAPTELNEKITFITMLFDAHVNGIDFLRVFSSGSVYNLEVHIIINEKMSLAKAHDIGESLQMCVQKLDCVERCYTHLDVARDFTYEKLFA